MTASELTVRPASPADAGEVSRILAASYTKLFADWYDERLLKIVLPLLTTASPALLCSGTYYLAEHSTDGAIAVGGWTPCAPPAPDVALLRTTLAGEAIRENDPAHGHIRHFATDPAHLRRGAARALFERSRQEALASGLQRLMCRSSLPAEAFYASCEFSRIADIGTEVADGLVFPSVLMILTLKADAPDSD